MMKLVFCCNRRSDLSLEEFHAYWLNSHGDLVRGVRHNFPTMTRYVQSHLVVGPATDAARASRGTAEPFDGITEVWIDESRVDESLDPEEVKRAALRLLEDELSFVDMSRSSVFMTVEHEIF